MSKMNQTFFDNWWAILVVIKSSPGAFLTGNRNNFK